MILTQRIFWPSYNSPEKLRELIDFLRRHRHLADEISFFTEGDGMDFRYIPLPEVYHRAAFLKVAVKEAAAAGFIPVINVLNTLGHSDEGGADATPLPWQGMVGPDGTTARQCSCPADSNFLDYVYKKYAAFAACEVKRIWIDDDLRFHNHAPVQLGCFCDQCLADFGRDRGEACDREELTSRMSHDAGLRREWNKRNGRVFRHLLGVCAQAIAEANPATEIGLMVCDTTDIPALNPEDADSIADWFSEVRRHTAARIWIRAGGGFWNDDNPRGALLPKLLMVGDSSARIPEDMGCTYEVENYPFLTGGKSAQVTGLECLLALLTARLDGIMFDVLDPVGNGFASFENWTHKLGEWLPLWNEAEKYVAGTVGIGWRLRQGANHFSEFESDKPLYQRLTPHSRPALVWQLVGIPLTSFPSGTRGNILSGDAAAGMTKAELAHLLNEPLILDGSAAQRFLHFGLGESIGITSLTPHSENAFERFTDHTINAGFEGYRRVATLRYFGLTSYSLQLSPEAESVSDLLTYSDVTLGSALSLFRGTKAPVAVIGHMPWTHVRSPQRMEQLRRLTAEMLGPTAPPFQIHGDYPIVCWVRMDAQTTRGIAVLHNAGFDTAIEVPLTVTAGWSVRKIFGSDSNSNIIGSRRLTLSSWAVVVLELTK